MKPEVGDQALPGVDFEEEVLLRSAAPTSSRSGTTDERNFPNHTHPCMATLFQIVVRRRLRGGLWDRQGSDDDKNRQTGLRSRLELVVQLALAEREIVVTKPRL